MSAPIRIPQKVKKKRRTHSFPRLDEIQQKKPSKRDFLNLRREHPTRAQSNPWRPHYKNRRRHSQKRSSNSTSGRHLRNPRNLRMSVSGRRSSRSPSSSPSSSRRQRTRAASLPEDPVSDSSDCVEEWNRTEMFEEVDDVQYLKAVVVGDSCVGKTCLVYRFSHRKFPRKYVPTICENYPVKLYKGNRNVELDVWDTAGQEEYDRLRCLSYPTADIIILCFSLGDRQSFERVESRWIPELRHFIPETPIVLVGTKVDLRLCAADSVLGMLHDEGQLPKVQDLVTVREGLRLAQKGNCQNYLECSALGGQNVAQVFHAAVDCVEKGKKKKEPRHDKNQCLLL